MPFEYDSQDLFLPARRDFISGSPARLREVVLSAMKDAKCDSKPIHEISARYLKRTMCVMGVGFDMTVVVVSWSYSSEKVVVVLGV